MAKKTIAQTREEARVLATEIVKVPESAEAAGQNAFAVPVEVDGQEIWVLYTATVPQWYDTEKTKAFNPFVKQEEWEFELAGRVAKKLSREKAKQDKIARQQAKKAQ